MASLIEEIVLDDRNRSHLAPPHPHAEAEIGQLEDAAVASQGNAIRSIRARNRGCTRSGSSRGSTFSHTIQGDRSA